MSDFVSFQLLRLDAKNAFVEVAEAFDIGKIRVSFRKYDKNRDVGGRITAEVDIFFSPQEAGFLANLIKGKAVFTKLKDLPRLARAQGITDLRWFPIYESPIGCNADKSRYRKLAIYPSSEYVEKGSAETPFALCGISGPGKPGSNGLVAINGVPDTKIFIPMSAKGIYYLADALDRAVRKCDDYAYSKWLREKKSFSAAR